MKCLIWIVCVMAACTHLARAADVSPTCRDSSTPAELQKPIADLESRLPVPDYLDDVLECSGQGTESRDSPTRIPSPWLEADTKQYATKLAQSKFEWLVLPAQTQYYGFDRIERALIGAEVADALGDSASVPDTLLVARALGEVRRRYAAASVYSLATAVGARQVIEVYAGHDGKMHMTLTLQLKSCSATTGCKLVKQRDWRALAFTDERPPFLVVRALQSAIRRDLLGLPALPPAVAAGAVRSDNAPLTVTPAKLATAPLGASPSTDVLLAALVPELGEAGRTRLNAWALRAALRAGENPQARFLAACAAAELNRRPYALKILEGLKEPESKTLRHLLNGNLTDALDSLKSVSAPLPRLLLAMSVQRLSYRYRRETPFDPGLVDAVFGAAAADWRPLVERRVTDPDMWKGTNSRTVKLLLDGGFPVTALSLRAVEQGSEVLGAAGGGDLDVANLRHVRAAIAGLNPADCCARVKRQNSAWQIYWLLEASAEANVQKQLAALLSPKGLPDRALRRMEAFEAFLAGQPQFEMTRARAARDLGAKSPGDEAARYEQIREQAQRSVAYWAQGQTPESRSTANRASNTMAFADAYSRDFPRRPYWPMPMWDPQADEQPLACVALAYSVSDLEPGADCLAQTEEARRPQLLVALRARFHGSPHAEEMFGEAEAPNATPVDPVEKLRASIRKDPANWLSYRALGERLIQRDGKYAEAQRVYLSYPGFNAHSGMNAVELSNYAYQSGSELYWMGQPDLARPLYEFAAGLDTGSEASITSAARLAQLEGDFETAASETLARATRYGSPYAYREYLSLLHAMGFGEQARNSFLQIADRSDNPQSWIGALVGDRMSGAGYEQMKSWVLSNEILTSHYRGQRFAPWYAMIWMTTDRKPGADFPRLMEQIERDAVRTVDSPNTVARPHRLSATGFEIVRASMLRDDKAPVLPMGTRVKSEYVLLADALTSFHAADYPAAVGKFTALADRYSIEGDSTEVALAYFAFAAAKTGDQLGLERFIESLPGADLQFDVWLSRAFFAAARRDAGKAATALERAFNVRPYTDYRPIMTEYQFAEACEIVRNETGDPRFDRMIVDWARKHQRIQPTQAWAYAMEAQYSQVAVDVNRALAMTIYLDPASPRLKKFKAGQISAARAWLRENNPFTTGKKPAPERVTRISGAQVLPAP